MGVPTVVPVVESLAGDPTLTGEKAANLARVASEMPVPPGFCVTTEVYRTIVDEPAVREAIRALDGLDPDDTEAIETAGKRVRETILETPLAESVKHTITGELAISGIEEAYAVRASPVSISYPSVSFEGQLDTILNVVGPNAVSETVKECMASVFSTKAIVHRLERRIPHDAVACAVLVQRMRYPDVSGVARKVGGGRRIETTAFYGLDTWDDPDAVAMDVLRVDAATGEVRSYEVGEKQQAVYPAAGGGTETTAVDPERRDMRVLDDDDVSRLSNVVGRVFDVFDDSVAVEWCLDEDGVWVIGVVGREERDARRRSGVGVTGA
ncbi:PEP/pyruvate-binding domain-containing protein [Haloarchaeobius sp. TZWWS8]|uniref:PEP/pyruvate-binding domain-containing protein n=1 Tax=Haloarchaeobius sp. TZWWS8 TaxID=3446121 RepID=UPI003EC052F0